MQHLNFPYLPQRIRRVEGVDQVFDDIRKKWVVLTPEEWVRQHLIEYLIRDRNCPPGLISVEKGLEYNGMKRRYDLVVFARNTRPILLVECKAPEIKVTEDVFDQAARYNMTLQVPFLMITNGLSHFCCHINLQERSYSFLKEIPHFEEMSGRE